MISLNHIYSQSPLLSGVLVMARQIICPFDLITSQIPTGQNVLVVVCGVSALIIFIALKGDLKSGIGCDINSKKIDIAKRTASRISNNNLFFLQIKNIDEIPHGPFDVVTLIDVIHHVTPSEQKKLLTSFIERVRPGGLLIYKNMADRPLWKNLFNRLHDLIFSLQLIRYVPLEKVNCMKLILKKYYSRFGYAHELLVFKKY